MARKKKEKKAKKVPEGEELQEGKKKGKKKLLLIPLVLIVVAAVAAAAVLFILPRFGIDLLGGKEPGPGEEEPPKNLETFIGGEPISQEEGEDIQDITISLDTLLEEGEGTLLAVRKPDPALKSEGSSDASSSSSAEPDPGVPTYTYIYDVPAPAAAVDRYLDAVLGGEEGFVLVDETYLHLEERPELSDALGSLIIARPSVQEGHVFQIMVGWSEASTLTFRASAPEGAIHEPPDPEDQLGLGSQVVETASLEEQMEKIKGLSPTQLGLEGDSMDAYELLPVEGFVTVDSLPCRRFNVYTRHDSAHGSYTDIVSIIMLSTDQQHVYYMDPVSNAVTELR
ncbi:MAG: hypothetical protein HFF44_02660 [Lawsonibacter sp.]|nr:hypothetical protein [Lawsonibacter sp.]